MTHEGDDIIDNDDPIGGEDTPKRSNRGGPRQKGVFGPKPEKGPRGGPRPGGGRPAGTFKMADGEVIKVGKTKSKSSKELIADIASASGIELHPMVANLSMLELQNFAAKVIASAGLKTNDPEDMIRKLAQAASIAARTTDYYEAKVPTSSHVTIDRTPEQMSMAEVKAILLERANAAMPLIEGTIEQGSDDGSEG